MTKIRIGFVGGGKDSWTENAHMPGLETLGDKFEVVAVSTTKIESAKEFAEQKNIPHYFDNADDLVNLDKVDLVVISVKVPYHHEIATKAIKAGKNVYCEWPLGNGYAESEELTNLAKEHNVKAFIGLQARSLPEINFLRDYIKEGNIGRVLSTSVIGTGMAWGSIINKKNVYLYDKNNGATLITIPFGHSIDAIQQVLGSYTSLNALIARRREKVVSFEDNEVHEITSPDQLLLSGLLENDIPISVHYKGGTNKGTPFLWEINGEKGDIVITGVNGHLQFGNVDIQVSLDNKELEKINIPEKYFNGVMESKGKENTPGYGMAHAYYNVYEDIVHNKNNTPTFEDTLKNHKLIDYIYTSSEKKQTVEVK